MTKKRNILFVCTGNSCRSQMAEGWARHRHGASLNPFSAGTEPGRVDSLAIRVMKEAGVDISAFSGPVWPVRVERIAPKPGRAGIFGPTHLAVSGECNILVQKMHTLSTRARGSPRTDS